MNFIKLFLVRIFADNMMSALRRIEAEAEKLEKAVEAMDVLAEAHAAKAEKHSLLSGAYDSDIELAKRLATELRGLVD